MKPSVIDFFKSKDIIIQKPLGTGGFGSVSLVYSLQYKTTFALKQIPKDLFNNTERELMSTVDDYSIVRLYNTYTFEDCIYLLLEYCPSTLDSHIMNTNLSDYELRKLIYNTICCVRACHQRKIAHCDIKPTNFLIDQYGRIKISDFGISCYNQHRTICHKGTKFFMAPEIFVSQTFNPFQSDIWALGVTLYFMATKSLPFYSQNTHHLITLITNVMYDEKLVKDPLLRQVIAKCLVAAPYQRATVDEILEMPYFNAKINSSPSKPIMKPSGLYVRPKFNRHSAKFGCHLSWNPEQFAMKGSSSTKDLSNSSI